MVDYPDAPSYIMCQATGFKNKSNSDLASSAEGGGKIPWEKFYVPGDDVSGQSYPFYTSYSVKDDLTSVDMYYIANMYGTAGQDNTKAGYWDLTGVYLPNLTLEENRNYVINKCTLNKFNTDGTIQINTK